jgi:hypothetical protein
MRAYNPYDAEYGDDPAPNGTVHTMTAAVSEPMDLYNASVAGVMLVGAVFACGVVLALSYFLWQACIIAADATIDALLWCNDRAKRRCACCLRKRTRRRTRGIDLPIDEDDEDGDDEARDARRTQTYVIGE